ncbi:MAG: DNA polymerase III subunit chi [Rhizobiaceae bacterium]
MTEVLFYHLTEHTLERALPGLLERSLERGWNVVVQSSREDHRDRLNQHLWTYQKESFLPHGCEGDDDVTPSQHPIWLTTANDNPINAQVRFMVDGAVPEGTDKYERLIYMFDGRDEDAVAAARGQWKIEKEAGHDLAYWQQDEEGRWKKKA